MTEREGDERVSQRYRELGAEEPPRELDAAILAAAHRGAGARRRWYLPLAAAAVIVLSVAVTVHMQREDPGMESPAPLAKQVVPAAPPPAAPQAFAIQPAPAAPPVAQLPAEPQQPRALAEAARRGIVRPPAMDDVARADKSFTPDPPSAAREEAVVAAAPRPPAAPASAEPPVPRAGVGKPAVLPPVVAESRMSRESADMAAKPAGNVGAAAGAAAPPAARSDAEPQRVLTPKMRAVEARDRAAQLQETPEKWLERIAELRGASRHDEADKQLAEFRQRYPDFRIPPETLKKVERAR
jgi:hypothetical protein